MSDYLFVSLSDIHARELNKERINVKMDSFIDSINGLKKLGGYKDIIILVSGDVAFSGKKSEYDIVDSAFSKLSHEHSIIMCAGNHDHDFGFYKNPVNREHFLTLDLTQQNEESIPHIISGMSEYVVFENKHAIKESFLNPLSKAYKITSSTGDTINVSALNTAWCSKIKEHGGDIKFPPQFIPQAQKNKLNIIFFHHPLAWFEPNNQKEIRNRLREEYSIILTGHEHLSDSFKIIGETSKCLMIESMPFDDENIDVNGFSTFEISENDIIVKNYHWDGNRFQFNKEVRKSEVMKGSSISTSRCSVQYEFYQGLLDIGVNFIHPDKDVIDLNDVFIYPNLKKLSGEDKLDMKKTSSETLLDTNARKILLIGDEYCGKSTLMKKLFIDAISKNSMPLLVEGGSVRNGGVEFDKIIRRHIR